MSRGSIILAIALLIALASPAAVFAQDALSPAEVVALGEAGDGDEVTVRGEALGEVLRDGGGGFWLNVLGDGTGVGLWGERETFAEVTEFGDYHQRGEIVEAVGTYNAACDLHGGDRDVHVTSLRVVSGPEPLPRRIRWWELGGGIGMALAALGIRHWYRRHADRV